MSNVSLCKKKIAFLFIIGFLIGAFLEIVLFELGKDEYQIDETRVFQDVRNGEKKTEIKLTCLIFMKHNHDKNLIASRNTWLPNCHNRYAIDIKRSDKNKKNSSSKEKDSKNTFRELYSPLNNLLKFITSYKTCSKNHQNVASISSNDVRKKITIETKNAWSGLCKTLQLMKSKKSHWFLIVPDNLFVVIDNLKYFVRDLNWKNGYYYGYAIKNYLANYNVLSAGILLSNGSVNAILERFKTEEDCDNGGKYWKNEDLYLGKYLKEADIYPEDTRDEKDRGRFNGYNINTLMYPGRLFNESEYKRKALYPQKEGLNCCSSHLITIDVSDADKMYHHHYYLYKVRTKHRSIPNIEEKGKYVKDDFYWKDFLRSEGYSEDAIENMTQEEYYKIWAKKLPPELLHDKLRNEFGSKRD